MSGKLVLWDFDGTLAHREGMWTGTLIEILQAEEPSLQPTRDELRPYLQAGFPWHSPDVPHPDIQDASIWWQRLTPFFERAFASLGLNSERTTELAALVRSQYCKLEKWELFDDALPALTGFARNGWSQAILSNHVPELPSIVDALGLASFFTDIYTSAVTGYEKPHAEAFRIGLQALPGASTVWMIGDNPVADIGGAEKVGIPSILVRKSDASVHRQCEDLTRVQQMIENIKIRRIG
jgi:putative hydrolase of the HAD superfamily